MPSAGRIAVVLLILAGLLFAAPSYATALVDDGDGLSTKELGARPLGESQAGEPMNETKDLVQTWNTRHVLDLQRYDYLSDRGRADHLDCNRAVNETVAVIQAATADGTAETTDPDVAADLQCLADAYDFYQPPAEHERGYYAFTVSTDDGATSVTSSPVNESDVAPAIRERELVSYADLNATEQRTVDRVLSNSTGSYGSYRPPADDPILDRAPVLLRVGEETYVIEVVGHVDDFNLAALFLYLGLRAVAVLTLIGALVSGGIALYR